jgi:lysozyme family protein
MSCFDIAIQTVLKNEGGYVNDPKDAGGATKFGLSLRWLQSVLSSELRQQGLALQYDASQQVTIETIQQLNEADAKALYRFYWWTPFGYEKIHAQRIATKIFDCAVNMGSTQAHRCVQRALRAVPRESLREVEEDGILGPASFASINAADEAILLAAIKSEVAGFYRSLHQPHFLNGWLQRAYA